MTQVPAQFAAEQALVKQNVALSSLKRTQEADEQFANIIADTIENSVPANASRGGNVNKLV